MTLGSLARLARYQMWKVDALRYRGSTFDCAICNGQWARMKPFEGNWSIRGVQTDHHTPNAICPRCHSVIRQRFVVEYLRQRTDFFTPPNRIIHFAPEISIYKMLTRAGADYVPADIDPSHFVGAVKADITDIPFPDEDFDNVICIHVLEHIQNEARALAELYRVLKPCGQALLAVPTYGATTYEDPTLDAAGREREYGTAEHVRMNGLDFADRLRAAGFEVKVTALDDLPGRFWDRSAQSAHIDSDRYLFHAVKPPQPR